MCLLQKDSSAGQSIKRRLNVCESPRHYAGRQEPGSGFHEPYELRKTPIHVVFNLVKTEAERYGVSIVGSELIGLAPMKALLDAAVYYLRLEDFSPDRVLEARIFSE